MGKHDILRTVLLVKKDFCFIFFLTLVRRPWFAKTILGRYASYFVPYNLQNQLRFYFFEHFLVNMQDQNYKNGSKYKNKLVLHHNRNYIIKHENII